MGGVQGKEILRKSPLGCTLAHWKDIAGELGGTLNKSNGSKGCIFLSTFEALKSIAICI